MTLVISQKLKGKETSEDHSVARFNLSVFRATLCCDLGQPRAWSQSDSWITLGLAKDTSSSGYVQQACGKGKTRKRRRPDPVTHGERASANADVAPLRVWGQTDSLAKHYGKEDHRNDPMCERDVLVMGVHSVRKSVAYTK